MPGQISAEATVAIYVMISLVVLVAALLLAIVPRLLETRLLLLGILLAVAAVCYGSVGSTVGVTFRAPDGSIQGLTAASGLGASLMKIALLLVLGGIAAALLNRWYPVTRPETPERGPDVPQA
jgi:hypothetical protein